MAYIHLQRLVPVLPHVQLVLQASMEAMAMLMRAVCVCSDVSMDSQMSRQYSLQSRRSSLPPRPPSSAVASPTYRHSSPRSSHGDPLPDIMSAAARL